MVHRLRLLARPVLDGAGAAISPSCEPGPEYEGEYRTLYVSKPQKWLKDGHIAVFFSSIAILLCTVAVLPITLNLFLTESKKASGPDKLHRRPEACPHLLGFENVFVPKLRPVD